MAHCTLSIGRLNESTSFITNPDKPTCPVSEPISIRTDMAQSSRYAKTMTNVSDIPDLTYDPDYATPPSATSSNMIPTPRYDWTPLADDPGDIIPSYAGKSSYASSIEDWPPSTTGEYFSPYSTAFSPSQATPFSSPSFSRDSTYLDGLDELNWEKQSYLPEFSPSISTSYPVDDNTQHHPKPFNSSSMYPLAATQHTRRNHAVPYSSPQASSSVSSAFSNTVSPSMLTLRNTVSGSVSSSHSTAQRHTPLKLHQPRPSRRIPIISLAELASASDGILPSSRKRPSSQRLGPQANSPVEALSPLPIDCHGFLPVSETRESDQASVLKATSFQPSLPNQVPNPGLSTLFRHGGLPTGKVITCSCGCMESYTIR